MEINLDSKYCISPKHLRCGKNFWCNVIRFLNVSWVLKQKPHSVVMASELSCTWKVKQLISNSDTATVTMTSHALLRRFDLTPLC